MFTTLLNIYNNLFYECVFSAGTDCFVCGHCYHLLLTAKYQVHAFFALLIACFVTGLGVQFPIGDLLGIIKDGFGNIMKSLGLIIGLGTILGGLLEHTSSTRVMANYILKKAGKKTLRLH